MTSEIENQLTAGMRAAVAGITIDTDILGAARRRHRRRAVVWRGVYAAGVIGLVAALLAALTAGATHDPVPQTDPPAAGADSSPAAGADSSPAAGAGAAKLRLAAAVAASDNVAFKVKIVLGSRHDRDSWGTAEGAFDPATATGYLTRRSPNHALVEYQRLVDGVLFFGDSNASGWTLLPSSNRLLYPGSLGGGAGHSAGPAQLFEVLRDINSAITQTGAHTYHFERTSSPEIDTRGFLTPQTLRRTMVGDLSLDAGNRIARVSYESQTYHRPTSGNTGELPVDEAEAVTMELSDYGVPVRVERPKDLVGTSPSPIAQR